MFDSMTSNKYFTTILSNFLFFLLPLLYISRDLSNILLLVIVFLSIIYIIINVRTIYKNSDNRIINSSFILFLTILFFFILHNGELRELDNYSRLIILLPIYFLFRDIRISKKMLIYCLCIISLISFTYATLDYATNSDSRAIGSSSSPITYGNMCMMNAIFLIASFIYADNFQVNKLIIIISFLLSLIAWSLTITLGSIIGLILCLVFLFTCQRIKIKWSILLSSSLVLLILILSSPVAHKISNIYSSIMQNDNNLQYNDSLSQRLILYKIGYETFKISPLVGIGFNKFEDILLNYEWPETKIIQAHPHNDFLDIAIKAGLFGLTIFIYFFVTLFKFFSNHLYKDNSLSFYSTLGILNVLGTVGFMMTQTLFIHHQSVIYFIILTLVYSSQITYYLSDHEKN